MRPSERAWHGAAEAEPAITYNHNQPDEHGPERGRSHISRHGAAKRGDQMKMKVAELSVEVDGLERLRSQVDEINECLDRAREILDDLEENGVTVSLVADQMEGE